MINQRTAWLLVVLLLSIVSVYSQEFEVVPDTVGIGLQKNSDVVDFVSSDLERCVLYHLGNPWAANVTGWLKVSGNLSTYFTRNSPESVFVPSGTFRHDSSCCLLPINTCFQFPYVLEQQSIEGRVFSDFSTSKVSASGGTGSRTGSSVAYTLTVNLKPAPELVIKAGQKKCFTFFEIGARCFSAPLIVLSDKLVEKSIESYTVTLHYQNNLLLIVLIVLLIGAVLIYTNRGKIRKTLNPVRKNIEGTKK